MVYVQLEKSDKETKKYKAIFYDEKRNKIKITYFGEAGANDFTRTHDEEAKQRYIQRHSEKEDWNNFTSAGSLAYHLLWTEKSMAKAYNKYIAKFNLKKY
jgi:hypothetical protein